MGSDEHVAGQGAHLGESGWLIDRLDDFARSCLHVDPGGYWLTRLMSQADSPVMADFRCWLRDQLG